MDSFEFEPTAAFSADQETRTITGVVVPYGEVARKNGLRFRFLPGSVKFSEVGRIKLLRDHDRLRPLGKAMEFTETPEGLVGKFSVAPGAAGDEALALAAHGTLDGFSVGVEEMQFSKDPQDRTVELVHLATGREVSLTAMPAFDASRLTSVRASADNGEETGMPETDNAPAQPVTFSAEQFDTLLGRIGGGSQGGPAEIEPRTVTQVNEPLPYRFSRDSGRTVFRSDAEFDFSTDLYAALQAKEQGRDYSGPMGRLNSLISAAFDVDRADTTDITKPKGYRPDLWQPQMDYSTPLWDMVASGTTDGNKFDVPKWNSSSGLVGPATEGTEPTPGAFAATLQTITPTQVWGKVEITRQAWRAGGNPQISGILWDQMLREYFEEREQSVATFLNTLTAATDITITGSPAVPTNDNDQASAGSLEAAIADLQFVRGGNRFRAFAVHQALYRLLARVTDDAGRPLYPRLNPTNANGTAADLFATLNVAGTLAVPAWALGAAGGNASVNSWLFDPAKVRGWASAPERLFWDFGATVQQISGATGNATQLAYVTLGIYGDVAFANLDINGVRQVVFDQNTAA